MQAVAKRLLDMFVASLLLLCLLPLLLIVGIVIRYSSDGPVFFKQRRIGRNGHEFWIYKFRTMVVHTDQSIHQTYSRAWVVGDAQANGTVFKLTSDPRVTRVGRILRRWSVDELPQLINVLRGEMSLVGPRPPLPYEVELYSPREFLRLSVSPGLTGLWQVSGRSLLNFHQMVDLDLAYIERWSIWLDLLILLRTPWVVLSCRGAD